MISVCVQEEIRINRNKIESASLIVQSNSQSKPHKNKKTLNLERSKEMLMMLKSNIWMMFI